MYEDQFHIPKPCFVSPVPEFGILLVQKSNLTSYTVTVHCCHSKMAVMKETGLHKFRVSQKQDMQKHSFMF